MRRCRPLMSSGTRAVSVVSVGINHHGWQHRQLQKSRTPSVAISSESRNLGSFSWNSSRRTWDLGFGALVFPPWLT
jgi:hypothetical protein